MKNFFFTTAFILSSIVCNAQAKLSIGTFYSSPLDQFCIDDYSDGGGIQFGMGLQQNIDSTWALEGGLNWQWGISGSKDVDLNMGNYDLSNKFYNWQIKLNLVKDLGVFKPFVGVHGGIGKYSTNEYLSFENTQEDGSEYYTNSLYANESFQYGAQLGTYIELNRNIDLNFSVSVNKGDDKVKYIDYDTYTFDGTNIDYVEKSSKPFMILFNASLVVKIFKDDLSNCSQAARDYNYSSDSNSGGSCNSNNPRYYYPSQNDTSESNNDSNTNTHYKNKETPSLIKNGKTPVGYK